MIIINDIHLQSSNIKLVKDLFAQTVDFAISTKEKEIYCLGDVFESRSAQRLDVLTAFYDILEMLVDNDLKLIVIPGNHDKSDYGSIGSFLKPYFYHPALLLYEEYKILYEEDYAVHLLPYFSEEILYDKISDIKTVSNKKNFLFSHFGLQGSINNDGEKVQSEINGKLLSKFDKVLLGHYHNYQQANKNTYHLHSFYQGSFAEDTNKGITTFDGEHIGHVQLKFPQYLTYNVKANSAPDILDMLFDLYKDSEDNIRFNVQGKDEDVKLFDANRFEAVGIKINKIYNKNNVKISENKKYTSESLVDKFKEFCEHENLDYKEGIKWVKN